MRKLVFIVLFVLALTLPARALDISAPEVTGEAQMWMPEESTTFLGDVWTLLKRVIGATQPEIAQAAQLCLSVTVICMLVGLIKNLSESAQKTVQLAGFVAVSVLILGEARPLITVAAETVQQLSDYGKLLLPVMTAALAAQGGVTSSTALYAATAVMDTALSTVIAKVLIPAVYVFCALCVASNASNQPAIKKLQELVKWLSSWGLKIMLYAFTGFLGITGVISGATDEAALKATKLTMSGMIPVVGGILSDASDAVIVGAALAKNSVGVYGMLAIIAIWIAPFLRIGITYLIIKLTAALSQAFEVKQISGLLSGISQALGLLLAMTGACCVLLLASMLCFMKGIGS